MTVAYLIAFVEVDTAKVGKLSDCFFAKIDVALPVASLSPISFPMEMAILYPLYRRVIRTESNIALLTTSRQDHKASRSLIDFRSIVDIRLAILHS